MDSSQQNVDVQPKSNLPVMAKKIWKMVRIVYIMLRKGISKGKLMPHIKYLMMKRTKLAGKSIQNLLHHHQSATSSTPHLQFPTPLNEYEFSCSNSPATYFPFHKKKTSSGHHSVAEDDLALHAVMKALEMLNSEEMSPALPGFGRTPAVKKLRVTDSPFPMSEVDEDRHVDEDAEEFIQKFYNNLRLQNVVASKRIL